MTDIVRNHLQKDKKKNRGQGSIAHELEQKPVVLKVITVNTVKYNNIPTATQFDFINNFLICNFINLLLLLIIMMLNYLNL